MTQRVVYRVERRETVTEDELASGDVGVCDCLVVHSINGRPGEPGAMGISVVSLAGETGKPITPAQLFVVWLDMAAALSEGDAPTWQRAFCAAVVRSVVKGMPRLRVVR